MADLSVDVLNMRLVNPTVLPSGILGEREGMLERAAASGASLLITKSITLEPRDGYHGPCVVESSPGGILNAMGLPNPGIVAFSRTYRPRIRGVPVVPSIYGTTPDELRELAMTLDSLDPPAIELNLSCPHAGGKRSGRLIAQDPTETTKVIAAVCATTDVPVIAKLSPNVTDIVEIAAAALFAGASAIGAVNTFEALDIDVEFERPVLGNFIGGLSGPVIRPLALRKVTAIALAMRDGRIDEAPIIAYGGAAGGEDIARFIMAGATAVGLGSVIYERDLEVFRAATGELAAWMERKGYSRLDDFRGNVLDWLDSPEGPEEADEEGPPESLIGPVDGVESPDTDASPRGEARSG